MKLPDQRTQSQNIKPRAENIATRIPAKKNLVLLIIALCIVIGIVLFAVYPNATKLTQTSNYVTIKYRTNGQVDIAAGNFETLNRSESSLGGAWYDSSEQYMVMKLSSTYYHYCGVPVDTWTGLKHASSLYSYYNSSVKGNYDCRINHVPSYYKKS